MLTAIIVGTTSTVPPALAVPSALAVPTTLAVPTAASSSVAATFMLVALSAAALVARSLLGAMRGASVAALAPRRMTGALAFAALRRALAEARHAAGDGAHRGGVATDGLT